jgi:UDP-2,4-diacetamido-2,4,6-trideoxy-beta-L-altropyranose hydrolase
MHLAIRADGGPEIGYGHLIRSNSIAEELITRDHEVTAATTTPGPVRSIFPDTIEIIGLPSRGDPEPFIDWLDANAPDTVFTDSYPVDTEYQRTVRNRVPLAVLQDNDRHVVCADLFVNGNLYAPDLNYEFIGQEPETCLGTDYVLLRSEIRNYAAGDPPWRDQPERALVTMGGSDIANLTPTVVRAFDGLDIHVDAIVGPGCPDSQERDIREAARASSSEVHVHRDPDDLAERMFRADFAVSTASSTTYELLALETPIVSIPVADNQEPIASALRDREAATVLTQESEEDEFRKAITEYMRNSELRHRRRLYGREVIDGRGTKRVADAIAKVTL